jgi:hypothetical protein
VSDDEWRIRASPGDKLILEDPGRLRREYIAELLKRNGAALAALDALGGTEFLPPPVNLDIMRRLHARSDITVIVNELVGMTLSGPVRKATERDRIVFWWLAHDIYQRAQVAAGRIKTEQRMRADFERMTGELGRIGRSGDLLLGFVEEARAWADKTEPIVGRKDDLRSPLSRSDVEAFRNWARRFRPEATPIWGPFFGVAFQPRDVVETSGVGIHSATGALAVIIPWLVKRRGCDRLIKKLIEAVFEVEIKPQEVGYRRKVLLTQRGFLPP